MLRCYLALGVLDDRWLLCKYYMLMLFDFLELIFLLLWVDQKHAIDKVHGFKLNDFCNFFKDHVVHTWLRFFQLSTSHLIALLGLTNRSCRNGPLPLAPATFTDARSPTLSRHITLTLVQIVLHHCAEFLIAWFVQWYVTAIHFPFLIRRLLCLLLLIELNLISKIIKTEHF